MVTKGEERIPLCCFPSLLQGKEDEKAGPREREDYIVPKPGLTTPICLSDSCLVPPCGCPIVSPDLGALAPVISRVTLRWDLGSWSRKWF